jgi:hypothetical protein
LTRIHLSDPDWETLTYWSPTKVLVGSEGLFNAVCIRKYKHPADLLLARPVRHIAENRRCAIFLHGASQALNKKILFAPYEKRDYDYVAAYEHNGSICRFPIQLKQLVPSRLNAKTDLQAELNKLAKYGRAPALVVAIHVNRRKFLMPQNLDVSKAHVKDTWILIGNLKTRWHRYEFRVPALSGAILA